MFERKTCATLQIILSVVKHALVNLETCPSLRGDDKAGDIVCIPFFETSQHMHAEFCLYRDTKCWEVLKAEETLVSCLCVGFGLCAASAITFFFFFTSRTLIMGIETHVSTHQLLHVDAVKGVIYMHNSPTYRIHCAHWLYHKPAL